MMMDGSSPPSSIWADTSRGLHVCVRPFMVTSEIEPREFAIRWAFDSDCEINGIFALRSPPPAFPKPNYILYISC